jgi:hypothetical protein
MKVYIFGAGASKGSQPDAVSANVRAPLVNELFDTNYITYAHEVRLPFPQLSKYRVEISQSESFESWITNKWKSMENCSIPFQKEAEIVFFGRFILYIWRILLSVSRTYSSEANVYYQLMDLLKNKGEPFGLINFNYDLLLDQAIKDVYGINYYSLTDYLNNNWFSYVKPHGSVNWLHPKRMNDPSVGTVSGYGLSYERDLISQNMFKGNYSTQEILVIDSSKPVLYEDNIMSTAFREEKYGYPIMFAPLSDKNYSQVQGFSETVIAKGKELMNQADEIIIIGYQAKDKIFSEEFLSSLKTSTLVSIVSDSKPEAIWERISKNRNDLKVGQLYNQGFEEYVKSLESTITIS